MNLLTKAPSLLVLLLALAAGGKVKDQRAAGSGTALEDVALFDVLKLCTGNGVRSNLSSLFPLVDNHKCFQRS